MMRRNLLLPALALALIALPGVAHAQYLTPEDVLLRDRNALYVPTTRRAAQTASQEQQERSAAQDRPTAVDWWDRPAQTVAEEPEDDGGVYSGPSFGEEDEEPAFGDEEPQDIGDDSEFDPVTLRWLRRLQQQGGLHEGPESETPGWGLILGPDGSLTPVDMGNTRPPTLHSGADLAGTGPAGTAAAVVMLGAVGWTLYRSRTRKVFLA